MEKEFLFTVTLTNPDETLFEGNKEYGGILYKDGVYTFRLKHGDAVDLADIPLNTTYTVTEESDEKFVSNITNDTGLLEEKGIVNVEAVNSKITKESQNITVTKNTTGDITSDEEFNFRAVLKGLETKGK